MSETKNSAQSFYEKVAEKTAAAKALSSSITSDIKKVLEPSAYMAFLNLIERFHWYSYINNLLIYFQFPKAECLAGFDVWKNTSLSTYNDPNRRILKEAGAGQGIKLIAPFTVVNNTSRSLVNVVVPVYDINQINDIPPPENDFLDLGKCNYVDIINAIKLAAPYGMAFASAEDKKLSHNVKGYCDHAQRIFVVDSRLSVRGLLMLLLHEYAAACLHLSGYKNDKLIELVEESVFYVLLKHFHLPVEDITFSYTGRYKTFQTGEISEAFYYIQVIAHSIIENIEDRLEGIAELTSTYEDLSYQSCLFDEYELEMEAAADEV